MTVKFPSLFLWLKVPAASRPLTFTSAKEGRLPLSVTLPSPFGDIVSSPFTVRSSNTDGVIVEKFVGIKTGVIRAHVSRPARKLLGAAGRVRLVVQVPGEPSRILLVRLG